MSALKAHQRLLESELPRTTHYMQEPEGRRARAGTTLPPVPVKWGEKEFRSLSHAASALGMARQTLKKKLGIE